MEPIPCEPPITDPITVAQIRKLFPKHLRPSHWTILQWAYDGHFCRFFKLSAHKTVFSKTEVLMWLRARGIEPMQEG